MEDIKDIKQKEEQLQEEQLIDVISGETLVTIKEASTSSTPEEVEVEVEPQPKEEAEEIKLLPARLPNALLSSMLVTREKSGFFKKYGIDLKSEIVKDTVDEEGNPIRLTKLQDRILLALSSEFSRHREIPKIKELINRTENGDYITNDEETLIPLYISLEELTGKVLGAKEKWKVNKQKIIYEELKKISEIKQLIIFNAKQKAENITIKQADFYFSLTGATRTATVEGKKTRQIKKIQIIFGRVFFERLETRAIALPDEYWELRDSTGRKISTTIFTDLTKYIFKLRWSHIYHDLPEAEKKIKKEGIADNEEKERRIKSALTHTISEEKIKEITNADYTNRKRRMEFWRDLWEALRAFIVLGVLTQETELNKEKGEVKLVYNSKYEQARKGIENIDIGYWNKNPFQK